MAVQISDEARARIAAEVAGIRDHVLLGTAKPKTKPRPSGPDSRRGHNLKGKTPKNKVDEGRVIQLRLEGMRPGEIATEVGCHRGTVSRILKDAGLTDSTDTGARRRQRYCQRGHDMDIHGREKNDGRGGRYCSECKRSRERVAG